MTTTPGHASNGMAYTGTGSQAAILLELTDEEFADLESNFPFQPDVDQEQFNRWCAQAYWQRHLFDDIDDELIG